jgi:glycosyltransferase involved in cell wall biosynthesis
MSEGRQMTVRSRSGFSRHCMVVFAHYPLGETRVQRQAEALLEQGVAVDVICLRAGFETTRETINGVQVYRLPVSRKFGPTGFARQFLDYLRFFWLVMVSLIRLQRRQPYQVVQVHNLPDFLIFAAWYPKLTGARLILDLHDLMPEFFAARTGQGMSHWLVRLVAWQEGRAARFAHHIITVTERWRQSLIRRGVPADKVSVVMNVADDRFFKRATGRDSGSDPAGFQLFYHGSLTPRYGVDLLVEAVARLKTAIPGLGLTIHGGGTYLQTLQALAAQRKVSDRITFSSEFLPMSALPGLIRSADVAVVPYRRDRLTDEILPTKLLEYVALGVPAVVARTPIIESYFDETMVEFFTPEDLDDLCRRLLALAGNRDRLERLSHQAEAFNAKYNWSKQKTNYLALLQRQLELAVGPADRQPV